MAVLKHGKISDKAATIIKRRSENRPQTVSASRDEVLRMLEETQNKLADVLLYVTAVKTSIENLKIPTAPAPAPPMVNSPTNEEAGVWG